MQRGTLKRLVVVLCGVGALSLQAACVTGRRTIDLPVAARAVPTATKGQVYIATITDDRQFQNHPDDPSTPSINGDVASISAAQKDQMIGRQRNTFGKAMGDIALPEGDTVTKRVRLLVEQGLGRIGYGISADPNVPDKVAVSIRQFWAWSTPGFASLTFEAKISCAITISNSTGTHVTVVNGYGINHGQVAKDGNWQEAYDPAFEDFMSNLVMQGPGLGIQAAVR